MGLPNEMHKKLPAQEDVILKPLHTHVSITDRDQVARLDHGFGDWSRRTVRTGSGVVARKRAGLTCEGLGTGFTFLALRGGQPKHWALPEKLAGEALRGEGKVCRASETEG
jgi:hypothetical protein